MGQNTFPPEGIIVSAAGIFGATGAGRGANLTAAQVRSFASVYSQAEVAAAFQPLDSTLTALAGVTTAADKVIYATGLDAFATATLSSYGRSLIDDADASTARTTLGLGTMATQASTSYLALTGGTLTGALSGTSVTFSGNAVADSLGLGGAPVKSSSFTGRVVDIVDTTTNLPHMRIRNATTEILHGVDGGRCYISSMTLKPIRFEVNSSFFWDFAINGAFSLMAMSSISSVRAQAEFVPSWVSSTDATRKAQVEEKVYDTAARTVARSFANGTNGYKALKVLATAPADADLAVSEVVFYTDGSGNLAIKLKDSGGTVRTGTVTLT